MRQIGKVALNVTNRSGFDKSHRNLFTGKVGTLIPILTEEVLPNSTIHLQQAISAKLPPLASDTFMNVQLKTEAFFVPYRLLYGGWENWLMETPLRTGGGTTYQLKCPVLNVDSTGGAGSLMDYLGWKCYSTVGSIDENINIFPFLAYARIYDDWYRNSRIQAPLFVPAGNYPGVSSGGNSNYVYYSAANLPFVSICDDTPGSVAQPNVVDGTRTIAGDSIAMSGYFADGSYILDLRQRNFGLDYFTSASPSAQRGNARSVTMVVNGETVDVMNETGDGSQATYDPAKGLSTSFSIASLRAQNSLQQFCERNNYSYRASDYYYINYGAVLKSGLANRAVFLGQQSLDVYTKSIVQNNNTDSTGSFNNPFYSVGAQYGNASIQGNDTLIGEFTAQEPGILMVLASLVPKVTYNTGMRKYLTHFTQAGSQTDLANAILQNVGNQPILKKELTGDPIDGAVFGYTDRYAEWMDHSDEIHGLLKDGQSLQSFALQRSFSGSTPSLNGSFLQIPDTYLDQVLAVSTGVSGMSYWAEAYFDFKVVQPLNEYSIPSLQDPAYEHGHKVVVNKNGGSL